MCCWDTKVENKSSSSSLDEETTELIEAYQKIMRMNSAPIIRRPIIRQLRQRANSDPTDSTLEPLVRKVIKNSLNTTTKY